MLGSSREDLGKWLIIICQQNRAQHALYRAPWNIRQSISILYEFQHSQFAVVDDLVLCQRVELHTDGKERKLNMLREMLRPGTKIRFQVTIDASICDMTEKDINQAVSYFGKNYFECFLQKYPGMDAPSEQSVWLGGGAGFVTKTEVYPLFGTSPGVELTARIFKAVLSHPCEVPPFGKAPDHPPTKVHYR